MNATLVITVYNNPGDLNRCLSAISRQTVLPREIIIADDGSETEPMIKLRERWSSLPLIHVWHADHGYQRAKILNRAVLRATGDLIVFTDCDCLPDRCFIEDHLRLGGSGKVVVGPRVPVSMEFREEFEARFLTILKFALSGRLRNRKWAVRSRVLSRIHGVNTEHVLYGANLGVFRKDLIQINGYDEGFQGWGKEDDDLAFRLKLIGVRSLFPKTLAVTYHLDHVTLPENRDNYDRLMESFKRRDSRCPFGLEESDQRDPKPVFWSVGGGN